jgi:hypothetical protein
MMTHESSVVSVNETIDDTDNYDSGSDWEEITSDNDSQPQADIHTVVQILVTKHTPPITAESVIKGKFLAVICILHNSVKSCKKKLLISVNRSVVRRDCFLKASNFCKRWHGSFSISCS